MVTPTWFVFVDNVKVVMEIQILFELVQKVHHESTATLEHVLSELVLGFDFGFVLLVESFLIRQELVVHGWVIFGGFVKQSVK